MVGAARQKSKMRIRKQHPFALSPGHAASEVEAPLDSIDPSTSALPAVACPELSRRALGEQILDHSLEEPSAGRISLYQHRICCVMTPLIFVTGGVVSSLGKGIASASLAAILEARGLRVTMMKLDPYINVDPGTMSTAKCTSPTTVPRPISIWATTSASCARA
jgi:hypothetical protein